MTTSDDFRDAIRAHGLTPPDVLGPGRFHRFPGAGKSNGNTAGFCKLFADERGGIYGDFSSGLVESWQAARVRPHSAAEREAFRRHVEEAQAEAEAKRGEDQSTAAKRATELWDKATPATPNPYLVRKGVRAHGVRMVDDTLLVPMRDSGGKLWNVERISADGKEKKGLAGGRRTGVYHAIGKPHGVVCIAEGYATGASVHESTGHAVAIAFNAGNLEAVARELRAKYPDATLILCADDDYKTAGNPGMTKATVAARAVGGIVAIPDFGADRPDGATDFNDLAQHRGAEAVERAVANARAPDVGVVQPGAESATGADSGPRVDLICATDVTPERVEWLWDGWLPAGKLCIVAGPPGTGKTTLALAMAATVTIGGRWPDGSHAEVGDVALWSGEDGIADTLVPRLLANGADARRVRIVRHVADGDGCRPFDPAKDTAALVLALSRLPTLPALLIVDPIVSAVAGDSNKNAETRRALQPLVDLGERIGCAILGISHFSKGTAGRDPVERVTGSIAFGALARVVMGAVKTTLDDGSPGPRLLARAKSNLGPDGGGFHYSLDQVELRQRLGVFASRVLWGEPVEGEARILLANAEAEPNDDTGSATDEAADWLRHFLDGGAIPATDAIREGRKLGFTDKMLRKARERLGVKSRKAGMQGGWVWVLTKAPEDAEGVEGALCSKVGAFVPSGAPSAKMPEDAQPLNEGTFDAFGDSRAPSAVASDAGEVF